MTPPPRFDGVSENGLRFLVLFDLKDVERSNLPVRQWMKTVWACFEGQAFDWINSHKEIRAILQKELPDEDDKKAFKKLICEKYPVGKKPIAKQPVVKKPVAAKVIHMQQGEDETIREYYLRIHDALVATGDMNILLSSVIRHWINGLNNRKLSAHLASRPANQSSLYDVCIVAERKLRQKEERRLQKKEERKLQKEYQVALQQQLQEFVDRGLVDDVSIAQSQKSYESPPVLEEVPCDLPEISTAIVDTDTESTDEVLASGPGKWIAAAAGKEVFDYTSTSDEAAKNPCASDTEASDNSFGWSRCCTVDVEVLNQEVFALAALYDAFLKNPPAEDMEISVAMDMPSLKHLMDMDGPAIEAFDSGIAIGAPSKNPTIQQTENPETMEKDSAYTYELPALPTFDHGIAIDFEVYTVDTSVIQPPVIPPRRKLQLSPFRGLALRNNSFGWSRCCTNPIGSRISSTSTCTSVSDVTSTSTATSIECATTTVEDTNFCEGEQSVSSCSVDSLDSASVDVISTSEDTDFYEGEQSSCSTNAVCTFVVVVNTYAALTLIVGMVMKNPAWMSFSGSIEYLAPKPKHKGLPKVKIKGY